MRKIFFLIFFVFFSEATPSFATDPTFLIRFNSVGVITCNTGTGKNSATAFIVSKNTVITVASPVIGSSSCSMWYKPDALNPISRNVQLALISLERGADIAIFSGDFGDYIPSQYSCSHSDGSSYFALGYDNDDYLLKQISDAMHFNTQPNQLPARIFNGVLEPQIMGGPVIDFDGNVIGVLDNTDGKAYTTVRFLSETSLCRKN